MRTFLQEPLPLWSGCAAAGFLSAIAGWPWPLGLAVALAGGILCAAIAGLVRSLRQKRTYYIR